MAAPVRGMLLLPLLVVGQRRRRMVLLLLLLQGVIAGMHLGGGKNGGAVVATSSSSSPSFLVWCIGGLPTHLDSRFGSLSVILLSSAPGAGWDSVCVAKKQ